MKNIIASLMLLTFFTAGIVHGQYTGVHAKVSFVDSLVKNKNSHESGFRLTIFNDSEQNYYVPNFLNLFREQIADSLFISKLKEGKYSVILKESGAPIDRRQPPFFGSTTYLLDKYFSVFKKKKLEADSIVGTANALNNKRSINALFLNAHERFTLYQISPADYLFHSPGEYRIDFQIRKRETENLPAEISGFKILTEGIPVESLYITVETLKAGRRIILKDSRQKKIRSFVWR